MVSNDTQESNPPGNTSPLLEALGVCKYFGTVTALNDVNLQLWPGEVLGVVGDNGAGKSTFMKVLSGLHAPSEGTLIFDGKSVCSGSPRDARNPGMKWSIRISRWRAITETGFGERDGELDL